MIIDARNISRDENLSCDVCIIGAGASGITVALECARKNLDVIVLEAGNRRFDARNQDLYRGSIADPEGHAPLHESRVRRLGGTTSLWGGRCIAFDNIDFERRPYVPLSGWPIRREDLEPYYAIAHSYCDIGSVSYDASAVFPAASWQMIPGFAEGDILTGKLERWNRGRDFGKAYFKDLKQAANIRLLLNASCSNIESCSEGTRISTVEATSLHRNNFRISAKAFVLSAGALEVTRLLLNSNSVHSEGIGNHSGWLGRCYMGHLVGHICKVTFLCDPDEIEYGFELDADGIYCRRRFGISEEAQRRLNIMNFVAYLDNAPKYDPSHRNGMLSFAYLALSMPGLKSVLAPGYQLRLATRPREMVYSENYRPVDPRYLSHLKNICADLPKVARELPDFFYKRFLHAPRLPGFVLKEGSGVYFLNYLSEQSPHRDSRISLSNERDFFGMAKLHVDYRIQENDIQSIYKAHQLLDRELRRQQCGYLTFLRPDAIDHIREQAGDGIHQIGTTRMSDEPANGVVDRNCRVHGIANLFVASSSIFPTSSHASPTLTIVAVAARIADRLERIAPDL